MEVPSCTSDCSILIVITGFSHANQDAHPTDQLSIGTKIHVGMFGHSCMAHMQTA